MTARLLAWIRRTATAGLGFAMVVTALLAVAPAPAAAEALPEVTATPTSGYAPLAVDFRISGADEATTTWSYGDGSAAATVEAGQPVPSHLYTAIGTFEVTVEVRIAGEAAPPPPPVTITVTRNPDAPVASIAVSGTLSAVGRSVTFRSTSSGTIDELDWDFGDGTVASGPGPTTHGYARAGTFTATLTARGAGLESTARTTIRVLSAWTGSRNLFRSEAFVKQYRANWCTAAAVQYMRNLALGRSNRSRKLQRRIMVYERRADTLADSRGSDPRGMARALVAFGAGSTYRDRRFRTRRAAVEAAARRIRITGKPVALLVWGGTHVWTMHGFRATADPAFTSGHVVTHVIVSGPLGGPRDPVNRSIAVAELGGRYGFRQYWLKDGYLGWYRKWVVVAP